MPKLEEGQRFSILKSIFQKFSGHSLVDSYNKNICLHNIGGSGSFTYTQTQVNGIVYHLNIAKETQIN